MSLYLTELGIEHDKVFADTGWEHPDTYEYLRGPLTQKIGTIVEVRAEKQMEQRIRDGGFFPSRRAKWCTQELKVQPICRYLQSLVVAGVDPVNTVGIRHEESAKRAEMEEWDWSKDYDCEIWRPLIKWTEQDVIEIHHRHGLAPNPLYLRGARRVGCWPCINSRKDEIRLVSETDPGRIQKLRDLEAHVTNTCREKVESRGEKWGEKRNGDECYTGSDVLGFFGAGKPIDSVVAWSKTAKGGKNLALFAPEPADEGCMRWGLCESHPPEKKEKAPVRKCGWLIGVDTLIESNEPCRDGFVSHQHTFKCTNQDPCVLPDGPVPCACTR